MAFQRSVCLCALLVLGVFLGACSQPLQNTPGVPNAAPATPPTKSGTIRFGTFSTPNASSMSWLMALEQLKQAGYNVETTVYGSNDLAVAALAQGAEDIVGVGSTSWLAIAKGANITSVIAHNANPFSIAATQAISRCSDLNGKSLATGSPGTLNTVLVNLYLKQNCATAAPNLLTITDSQAREAALLGGKVDATTVEMSDMQQLSAQAPGKFHTLVQFSTAFPKLIFTVAMVNRTFAAAHPDIVKDYVRSIITVNRAFQANPQLLRDAMVKQLKYTPAQAQALSDAYLAANIWDPNGGFDPDSIQSTLQFLIQQGTLPATLKEQDVADPSYLNTVLTELGHK